MRQTCSRFHKNKDNRTKVEKGIHRGLQITRSPIISSPKPKIIHWASSLTHVELNKPQKKAFLYPSQLKWFYNPQLSISAATNTFFQKQTHFQRATIFTHRWCKNATLCPQGLLLTRLNTLIPLSLSLHICSTLEYQRGELILGCFWNVPWCTRWKQKHCVECVAAWMCCRLALWNLGLTDHHPWLCFA